MNRRAPFSLVLWRSMILSFKMARSLLLRWKTFTCILAFLHIFHRSNVNLQLALICLLLALTAYRERFSRCPTSGPRCRISCFLSSALIRSRSRSCTSLATTASDFLMRRRCTAAIFSTISYRLGSLPYSYRHLYVTACLDRNQSQFQLMCAKLSHVKPIHFYSSRATFLT